MDKQLSPTYQEILRQSDTVQIGSTVEVAFIDGKTLTVTIGDSQQANPSAGIVSYQSPLGAALIGARVRDRRAFKVQSGERVVTIIRIEKNNVA